jgi:hypothetical protein
MNEVDQIYNELQEGMPIPFSDEEKLDACLKEANVKRRKLIDIFFELDQETKKKLVQRIDYAIGKGYDYKDIKIETEIDYRNFYVVATFKVSTQHWKVEEVSQKLMCSTDMANTKKENEEREMIKTLYMEIIQVVK